MYCMSTLISAAIKRLGGVTAASKAIGVGQPLVSHWIKRGVPAERVLALSAATDWHVTPHALRPDLYPNPTDGLPDAIRAQVEAGTWPPTGDPDERQSTHHENQEKA